MTTSTSFNPAASVTAMPDTVAHSSAMPTVDGANVDTMITVTMSPTWISFGAGAQVGPDAQGAIMVTPAAPLLLTNNATTLGATASNPSVISGAPATQAAAATTFNYLAMQRGGAVTITRGTAAPRSTF